MRKRFLELLICTMLVSVCVGCGAENMATEQPETTASTTTQDEAPAQTTEDGAPEQTTAGATTPESTEEPHTHNYTEEITTEATCEAGGLKTFTCECGDTYTETITATGHTYENYVYNEDATYTADGTETSTCINCDSSDTRPAEGTMLEYTYTEMNGTMYATQTINVRNLPNTDGENIGSLSTNQEITVIGQCNETGWYMFELDGQTAFVSNSYLSTEMVEENPTTSNPESSSATSNLSSFPHPLNTWTMIYTEQNLPAWQIYCTYDYYRGIVDLSWNGGTNINIFENSYGAYELARNTPSDLPFMASHYVFYSTYLGEYEEGSIYVYYWGDHYSTNPNGCPNFGTMGICRPGTID